MSMTIELPKSPSKLIFSSGFSEQEFEQLCAANSNLNLERTKDGEIVVNPPTGLYTGDGNSEIITQLRNWWATHELGRCVDSSTGFHLPDNSTKSPDAAYITSAQLAGVKEDELEGFPHFAPAFVIELRSPSDVSLHECLKKMEAWRANGTQLGWLIDPTTRSVYVFEPGEEARTETGPLLRGSGPIEGFVLDLDRVWRRYRSQ
jgi:Uma2 family endonuclease